MIQTESLRARREALVLRLRDQEKLPFTVIAKRLDLSHSRIGQLYHGAHHKMQFPPNGLSKTLNRLLAQAGFTIEKQAIIHALQTGKLYPHCRPPNYGKYAHRDVCRWAGVDPATLAQAWPDRGRAPHPDDGLSYRAHTILRYAGIPATRKSVLEALSNGQVTHAELCRWTGVDSTTLNAT